MLTNNIIWITGAGSGIGRATAAAFSQMGARVVVSGRTKRTIDRVAKSIVSGGGEAFAVVCDVSNEASVNKALKAIEKKWGPVDILINNAGIGTWKDFLKTSVKEFDETIATNLRGIFICAKAVAPSMVKRKSGMIINVLSTAAVRAFPGNSAYCASKFGGLGLTKVLRSELKQYNVRVTAVLPGAVETPMWDPAEREKYRYRMLQPEDVAQVMVDAAMLSPRALAEEILLRPLAGDI